MDSEQLKGAQGVLVVALQAQEAWEWKLVTPPTPPYPRPEAAGTDPSGTDPMSGPGRDLSFVK